MHRVEVGGRDSPLVRLYTRLHCEPESDLNKPESHLVGVRATLDPNKLSIAHAEALSMSGGHRFPNGLDAVFDSGLT